MLIHTTGWNSGVPGQQISLTQPSLTVHRPPLPAGKAAVDGPRYALGYEPLDRLARLQYQPGGIHNVAWQTFSSYRGTVSSKGANVTLHSTFPAPYQGLISELLTPTSPYSTY